MDKFKPRKYQVEAAKAAVKFLKDKDEKGNGLIVSATASGKSLIISEIANRLNTNVLVFCPSKEITEQNYRKMKMYTDDCSMYSASVGQKKISKVTFAMIGSVKNHPSLFTNFKYFLVDECFTGKQTVSTEIGKLSFNFLYSLYEKGIQLPRALSYNEKTGAMEYKPILKVAMNGKKHLIKVTFNHNMITRVTCNHPFLTNSGWVKAGDLQKKDVVISAFGSIQKGEAYLNVLNEDQRALVLGGIIGDASLDRLRKTYGVNRIKFVHGLKQKAYLEWKMKMMGITSYSSLYSGYGDSQIYQAISKTFFFRDEELTKRYVIEHLTPQILSVIYMDDGSLGTQQNYSSIFSVADSKELTELLVGKLQSMGLDCRLGVDKRKTRETKYYFVRFRKEGTYKLCEMIAPYVHPDLSYKIVDEYKHLVGSYIWNSNYMSHGACVVEGVQEDKEEKVYNMEVADNHTYVVCTSKKKGSNNGLIVHNCHLVNPDDGIYKMFFEYHNKKIVGLTATPYRLVTTGQKWNYKEKRIDLSNAESRLIPIVGKGQIFSKVLFNIETQYLLDKGYVAPMTYYDVRSKAMKDMKLFPNTSGAEFSERSLQWMEEHTGFYNYMVSIIKRLQHPKDGSKRNGILCFVRLVEVAQFMATQIPSCRVVSAKTPKKEREQILQDFADRKFQVLLNSNCLTTGFDRPDLDTVLLGCPTMSLARYIQECGRAMRLSKGKNAWIIDLGGNIERFGETHRIRFEQDELGEWNVYNDKRRLTNVVL